MAVDEVELSRVLKCFRDVQILGYLGIKGGILFISLVDHGVQAAASHESALANNVTSQPRATSPSVTLLATVSHAPYCRGGVRQATGVVSGFLAL